MPDTSPTPVGSQLDICICGHFALSHAMGHCNQRSCCCIDYEEMPPPPEDANLRTRTSIGPDSERLRELEAEVEKYKGALDEIDQMNPDDFRTGQGHLSPAFCEVNFRAAFAHVCRIVNRTLHGVDSEEGPSR